jgi:triacylglycerol lipase
MKPLHALRAAQSGSTIAPKQGGDMNIVLASGFLFPQRVFGINYFRGVQAELEKAGHQVLPPIVAPLAGLEARAERLAQQINEKFPDGRVHIIAHSMGGLDCRVMIGGNKQGLAQKGRILSLTTLSTPHQGSPVADLLAGRDSDDVRRKLFDALDAIHVDVNALRDLTSGADARVPDVANNPETQHIKYYSYAASGRTGSRRTAFLLLPAYGYVKNHQKPPQDNDSVVTVASASYGKPMGTWDCDHLQIVGWNLDTLFLSGKIKQLLGAVGLASEFDHLAKFREIVGELQRVESEQAN